MSYQVELTPEAIAGLRVLTSTIRERLLRKIRWLSENFDNLRPQALSADLSGLFKFRVGDYRIIYSFNTEARCVTVHRVGHRREIYKE